MNLRKTVARRLFFDKTEEYLQAFLNIVVSPLYAFRRFLMISLSEEDPGKESRTESRSTPGFLDT